MQKSIRRFPTLLLILLTAGAWASAENLKPADVKVFGALDYGDTSETVEYTGTPAFGAFLFNGAGKDRVEITVRSADRQAFVAIADGSLKQLASGTAKLTFTLPDHGSDAEAYYILFREAEGKPARFTVTVKKLRASTAAASVCKPIRRGLPSSVAQLRTPGLAALCADG